LIKVKSYLSKISRDIHLFELLRGASTTFIFKIVGLLTGYVLAVYITNRYGAHVFGQYVTALLIVEILAIISRLGLDTSLVRFLSKYVQIGAIHLVKRLYIKSMSIVIVVALIFSFSLMFFSTPIAHFMNIEKEYLVIVTYSFLPLVLFHMNVQAIRGLKKMISFSFLNTIAISLFTFLILVVMSYFLSDDKLPIYAYVVSVFLMTLGSYALWFRHSFQLEKNSISEHELLSTKELLNISFPLLMGQSMMLIMGKVDLFMLASMSSSEQVGIYNIALKLSMMSYMGLMAVNSIAAPKFSELHASGNVQGLKKIVQQSTKTIFWISLPSIIIFLFLPESILNLFGEEFKIAALTLIILSIGKMFSAISGSVGTFLQMVGKQKVFQNILVFAAALNIVLNYVLIPKYGIEGAAFASAISGVLWNLWMIIYIKKNFGFYTIYLPWIKK